MTLRYRQVDVFTCLPYQGNGLAVFPDGAGLSARQMLRITQELRQFESVFLADTDSGRGVRARIFTMEEELPFAGHPVLGAAAVLHLERCPDMPRATWQFELSERTLEVGTRLTSHGFTVTMDQGVANFGDPLTHQAARVFAMALGVKEEQLHPDLPLQVVSTGLPYLLVPLQGDIGTARIRHEHFQTLLETIGAKFVYVLDPERPEGRTWDNQGLVEDVATGSAAGPVAAYLAYHGRVTAPATVVVHQGARAGRPSELRAAVRREDGALAVSVEGGVVPIGLGLLEALPPAGS
ncbi:MAG TPA: PhzF family phenazine biosynthesis protein [Gemmatimonadales bacterium]|nr:PhzF family phenazine biosynthesis protein [Gemmatimonadales bacterium]